MRFSFKLISIVSHIMNNNRPSSQQETTKKKSGGKKLRNINYNLL